MTQHPLRTDRPKLESDLKLLPVLLGDHSKVEPPDPIPNSEVKRLSADGSVGIPHVRVGHRQAPNYEEPQLLMRLGFFRF